ncbi:MAG: PAS domain S-box protein [Acidobacteria bacterium]|nr:PAS domain S-box protein [Acidobacteriota bacterium]
MTRRPSKKPQPAPPGGTGVRPEASDFEDLFDALPDPAFIFDRATLRILATNESAIRRYGWTREEFLGMTVTDLRPESEREKFLAYIKDFPKERRSTGDWYHRTKDGHAFAVETQARDILFKGQTCRLVLARDAFERQMAWQALRETQDIYSNLVENLSEGVAILSEEGRFIFVNAACGQIFGVEPNELLGKSPADLFAPESRVRHPALLARGAIGGKDAHEVEILRPNGERRWLAVRAAPRKDATGRFAGSVASFFDITQHRLALEAHQQSEARFRKLVEMLPQGLVTYQDGRITYSNPAAAAITRTNPDHTVGRPILDFIHPAYWGLIKERFEKMARGESVPPMDYIFRRSDDTEVWVDANAQVLEAGEHPVMITVFTDLTHRRDMEQAIRENEERFRILGQQTGQLIYDYDLATGAIRWVGPSEAMVGESLEELAAKGVEGWEARIHPEDREASLAELARCSEAAKPYRTEYRFMRKDGTYFPVEDHGIFLTGPDGRAIRMLGTMRDISERYLAAQAVRESEERYRSVVEQAQDMIFLVDLDSLAIVQANQAFHQVLGYPTSAIPTLTLPELVDADPASITRNLEAVAAHGSVAVGRRTYRCADGTTREVEVTGSILRSGGQHLMVALARDISERLATERALQQAQKMESLGVLAGGIAHDFNNLLTAMMGNLNLAQMKSHPSSPSWPYLDALERSLQRAADLTRQMLAYSGKGRFVTQTVDLNQVVSEMTHLLSVSISKDITLRFDLGRDLPPMDADPAQLQQVVMNLVTNASDAIGDHEGVIRLTTRAVELDAARIAADFPSQLVEPGPHLLLEIADTGCGMDAATQQRIFEPFFTTKVKGRGLGLSAMLGILRGHRSGIRIQSTMGQGTTFQVYLPSHAGALIVKEDLASSAPLAIRPDAAALVVDDEPSLRESAVELFRLLGFGMVFEAGDGLEALEVYKARKNQIVLVFMDLTMPQMNGGEAFRAMRAMDPQVKVILTSGFDEESCLEAGEHPSAFLQKPYRFRQLRNVVAQVLHHKGED